MTEQTKQLTRAQALLLIDMAVKMSGDSADGKHRALFYLRRAIPAVLPCWIETQVPIQEFTPKELIDVGRMILDGGVFDEASGMTCEEIIACESCECEDQSEGE